MTSFSTKIILIVVVISILLVAGSIISYDIRTRRNYEADFTYARIPNKNATTSTAQPTTQTPMILRSCVEISKTGEYTLDQDIVSPDYKPCINIRDTNHVVIDCLGHSISSDTGQNAISINKVNDFTVRSCVLKSKEPDPPSDTWAHVLFVTESKNGIISKNILEKSTFGSINKSSYINLVDNTFYSQLLVDASNNITIEKNKFTFVSGNKQKNLGTQLNLTNGNHNKVIANTFDGGSDGVYRTIETSVGADDSITMSYVSNDVYQDNVIKNVWDCGIENLGTVFDSKIINNRITNTGVCAIGGWYLSSLRGNLIKDNVGDSVPSLFYFYRTYALKSGEQYVYFKDNIFENNKLVNPKLGTGFSVGSRIVFNGGDVPLKKHILSNNILKNNDFTKNAPPLLITPGAMILDGGGNICSGAIEETNGNVNPIAFNCN